MSATTTVISDAPWRSPALPTIVVIPGPTPVTVPSWETVAAAGLDELHETGQPFLSTTRPVRRRLRPSPKILTGLGETSIAAGLREQPPAITASRIIPIARRALSKLFQPPRRKVLIRITGLGRLSHWPPGQVPATAPSTARSAAPGARH